MLGSVASLPSDMRLHAGRGIDAEVRVGVDDAGRHPLAAARRPCRSRRGRQVCADGRRSCRRRTARCRSRSAGPVPVRTVAPTIAVGPRGQGAIGRREGSVLTDGSRPGGSGLVSTRSVVAGLAGVVAQPARAAASAVAATAAPNGLITYGEPPMRRARRIRPFRAADQGAQATFQKRNESGACDPIKA